jgi:hypothetical protein
VAAGEKDAVIGLELVFKYITQPPNFALQSLAWRSSERYGKVDWLVQEDTVGLFALLYSGRNCFRCCGWSALQSLARRSSGRYREICALPAHCTAT